MCLSTASATAIPHDGVYSTAKDLVTYIAVWGVFLTQLRSGECLTVERSVPDGYLPSSRINWHPQINHFLPVGGHAIQGNHADEFCHQLDTKNSLVPNASPQYSTESVKRNP